MAHDDPFAETPYRGEEKLGEGAHGAVWGVEHRLLGTKLAAKLVHQKQAGSVSFIDRMRAEAQVLAKLDHPHLVKVRDLALLPDGRMYFVMDRLRGSTLKETLALDGPLSPRDACTVARQTLEGLAVAHRAGIVHRDVKPANIFCEERDEGWHVKVVDFGVAKLLEDAQITPLMVPTATGTVAGTPRYMAPELIVGRTIDARVDIYAVGVILYECLVGRTPFHHHKGLDVLVAHVQEAPRPPSLVARQPIPGALDRLVLRALEKDPELRIATAEDYLAAIDAAQDAFAPASGRGDFPVEGTPVPVSTEPVEPSEGPIMAATTRFEDDPALRPYLFAAEDAQPTAEAPQDTLPGEDGAGSATTDATELMRGVPLGLRASSPAPGRDAAGTMPPIARVRPENRHGAPVPLLVLAILFVIIAVVIASLALGWGP